LFAKDYRLSLPDTSRERREFFSSILPSLTRNVPSRSLITTTTTTTKTRGNFWLIENSLSRVAHRDENSRITGYQRGIALAFSHVRPGWIKRQILLREFALLLLLLPLSRKHGAARHVAQRDVITSRREPILSSNLFNFADLSGFIGIHGWRTRETSRPLLGFCLYRVSSFNDKFLETSSGRWEILMALYSFRFTIKENT